MILEKLRDGLSRDNIDSDDDNNDSLSNGCYIKHKFTIPNSFSDDENNEDGYDDDNCKSPSVPLPEGFKPGPNDVICARGKTAYSHPGNRQYRKIIESYLSQYSKARTKLEKSYIVSSILQKVKEVSTSNVGFISKSKKEGGNWYEVSDRVAREKVGQSFRDLLHTKYRSSSKAKKLKQKKKLQRVEKSKISSSSSVTNTSNTPQPMAQPSDDTHQMVVTSADEVLTQGPSVVKDSEHCLAASTEKESRNKKDEGIIHTLIMNVIDESNISFVETLANWDDTDDNEPIPIDYCNDGQFNLSSSVTSLDSSTVCKYSDKMGNAGEVENANDVITHTQSLTFQASVDDECCNCEPLPVDDPGAERSIIGSLNSTQSVTTLRTSNTSSSPAKHDYHDSDNKSFSYCDDLLSIMDSLLENE